MFFQLEETMSNVKAALRITKTRQSHLVDIHDAVEVGVCYGIGQLIHGWLALVNLCIAYKASAGVCAESS